MLKEIHEQADAVAETVADRIVGDEVDLGDIGITDDELRNLRRVIFVACGTSYHAGLMGRYATEAWARMHVEIDIASEFRYRNPVLDEHDLVVGISQSGETADTLAAMRLARERGAKVIGGDQRDGQPGHARLRRRDLHPRRPRDRRGRHQDLRGPGGRDVPALAEARPGAAARSSPMCGPASAASCASCRTRIDTLLAEVDEPVRRIADHWKDAEFFLYLGRHIGLPVCLEGALKLKEISYIPTDAYAAGEMKHGPIALLDDNTPVVCVATDSPVLDKVLSNIAEVRARGAHVVAVATHGNDRVDGHAEEVVKVPATDWFLQPILAVIPLQLLAYYIARARGLNVDQPRNLAKTVTVE